MIGPGYLTYTVGGAQFRVGHLSFFQVNRFMVEPLVDAVVGDDARQAWRWICSPAWDLFTVALTKQFERVIGVESNLAAAKDLETNLKESGGASPASRNMTAEGFLSRWHETPDLVVLDPPRAGIETEALARTRRSSHRRASITFPAIRQRWPATWRIWWARRGSRPVRDRNINLFDIFPQTYHMEVLVRLKRRA